MNTKGNKRREELISAAVGLLDTLPVDEISLAQIATEAGIPTAAAYQMFSNAHDVFSATAKRFGRRLLEAICGEYQTEYVGSWQELYAEAVDRGVEVYRTTPAYCQLILGPRTPPAVKVSDRENDAKIGVAFASVLERYFDLPDVPLFAERVFYSIEIVDMFLTLSFIHNGRITDHATNEAKTAAIAYLERYLGKSVPRRS